MISDVLFEAVEKIERHQRDWPQAYDGLRVEIGKVAAVMNALLMWLDCPPSKGWYPRYEAAHGRLRAEIAGLDVEPLLRAMADLKASWPTNEEVKEAKASGYRQGNTRSKTGQPVDARPDRLEESN